MISGLQLLNSKYLIYLNWLHFHLSLTQLQTVNKLEYKITVI